MENIIEAINENVIEPLMAVDYQQVWETVLNNQANVSIAVSVAATGVLAYFIFSLFYTYFDKRQRGKTEMKRVYTEKEMQGIFGRVTKEMIQGMVHAKRIEQQIADEILTALAFRYNNWDLHPKPKKASAPLASDLKEAIKSRRVELKKLRVNLPSDNQSTSNPLEDVMRSLDARAA